MDEEKIKSIYEMLDTIPITSENVTLIEEIKEDLAKENLIGVFEKINQLKKYQQQSKNNKKVIKKEESNEQEEKNDNKIYPEKLSAPELERTYIGLLFNDPKYIVKFYFLYNECFFEDEKLLNLYKSVLYTEGAAYAPEIAKDGFNFARDTQESYDLKYKLKKEVADKNISMEKIYRELKKLFILRKNYTIKTFIKH